MFHTHRIAVGSKRQIPAALALLFGLAPLQSAGVQLFTNCNDSGAGSLRQAILDATDGEEVDASQLQCSKISLTTGMLIIAKSSLTINGPGRDLLTIDGAGDAGQTNIFLHNGYGTLSISDLAIKNGYFYLNDAQKYLGGGCIFSAGNVLLDHATISDCTMATGNLSRSRGGAVFAEGNVTLLNSSVSGNEGIGAPYGGNYYRPTFGGAIFAKGHVLVSRSVVSNNRATHGGGIFSKGGITLIDSSVSGNTADTGGGIDSRGVANIHESTISGNHSLSGGALYLQPTASMAPEAATISNSTISGNTASALDYTGSAVTTNLPLTISASTIAFNSGPVGRNNSAIYAAGASLKLDSSIVAENRPADVTVQPIMVSGAGNLVTTTFDAMPSDTIVACPQLEPLADNGGLTRTHALRLISPAIDGGSGVLPATDQRGDGFPRPFGAFPDIGALEWQGVPVDAIFASGFQDTALFCDS